jgi:hypothetical protein
VCALAGCGTSVAEYQERAGTICRDATEPLRTQVQGRDFGDLDELAPEARKRYAMALERFEALEPPDERRDEHEALLSAARRLRAGYHRLADAADRTDEEAALAALSRSKRDRLATARAARALDLRVCAEGVEAVADGVLVPIYLSRLRTLQGDVEVGRQMARERRVRAAVYSGDRLIDHVREFARLEPPRNAADVHDRLIQAVSMYGQSLVTRGRGDAAPVLRAIREARRALRRAPPAVTPS